MSLAMHGSFSSVPGLRRLLTFGNPCADPQNLHEGDGYTNPEPRTLVATERETCYSESAHGSDSRVTKPGQLLH